MSSLKLKTVTKFSSRAFISLEIRRKLSLRVGYIEYANKSISTAADEVTACDEDLHRFETGQRYTDWFFFAFFTQYMNENERKTVCIR